MITTYQQHDIDYQPGESYQDVGSTVGKRYIEELKSGGYPFFGNHSDLFRPEHVYFDGSIRYDGPRTAVDHRLNFTWVRLLDLQDIKIPWQQRESRDRRYRYGWIETKYRGAQLIAWCSDDTVMGIPDISRCLKPVEHGIPGIMSAEEFDYIRMVRSPQWV